MEAKIKGHRYELANYKGDEVQTLKFIKKKHKPTKANPDRLVITQNGTTNEEVLEMLIDRFQHLEGLLPDENTRMAIKALKTAQAYNDKRREDRRKRGVLGTHKK